MAQFPPFTWEDPVLAGLGVLRDLPGIAEEELTDMPAVFELYMRASMER